MTAIPHELLARIANPTGGENVLQMFMQGQQQAMQNDEWGRRKRHDNALLQAGPMIDRGEYGKAAGVMGGVGDTAAQLQFISMQQKQDEDARNKQLYDTLFSTSHYAPPSPAISGPPAGGYRGPMAGGQPRMAQPRQATAQPGANGGIDDRRLEQAKVRWLAGDKKGAMDIIYSGGFRPATAQEKAQYNQPPDAPMYFDGDGQPHMLSSGTNINVNTEGLSAEEQSAGKERGSRMDALESGKSIGNLQQIQLAGRLLQNVDSGALAGLEGTAGNIFTSLGLPLEGLKYLGIDPNLVTTGPQIQALINRQVVGMIGSGQFPAQNFSDTDRIFLEKILPSLSNQPEANALITATTERMLQVETEKRQAWTEARKQKISYRDFEAQWNDMLQQQDIFGEIAKQASADSGGNEGWTDLPGGNRIRQKGR